MDEEKRSECTDRELMEEARKVKPSPIVDALFIGFLIGIIIYSVVAKTWGFLTVIPLFMVYRLVVKSKRNEALKKELQQRGLE